VMCGPRRPIENGCESKRAECCTAPHCGPGAKRTGGPCRCCLPCPSEPVLCLVQCQCTTIDCPLRTLACCDDVPLPIGICQRSLLELARSRARHPVCWCVCCAASQQQARSGSLQLLPRPIPPRKQPDTSVPRLFPISEGRTRGVVIDDGTGVGSAAACNVPPATLCDFLRLAADPCERGAPCHAGIQHEGAAAPLAEAGAPGLRGNTAGVLPY
jgi:hypothetical protein